MYKVDWQKPWSIWGNEALQQIKFTEDTEMARITQNWEENQQNSFINDRTTQSYGKLWSVTLMQPVIGRDLGHIKLNPIVLYHG